MAFKTGRSRTVTYTGTMSAEDAASSNQTFGVYKVVFFQYACSALGSSFSVYNCTGSPPSSLSPQNGTVTASDSHTGTSDSQIYHHRPAFPTEYDIGVSGTWSITVTVEEWCDIYTPSASTAIYGENFPTYSFPVTAEANPAKGARFYEKTKIGTTKTSSITVNGVTASCSATIASEIEIAYPVSYSGFSYLIATDYGLLPFPPFTVPAYNTSITASSSPPLGIPAISKTIYWPDGGTQVVASISDDVTIQLNTEGGSSDTPFVGGPTYASFSVSGTPAATYDLQARLRSFSSSYIANQTMTVNDQLGHASNVELIPDGSLSIEQSAWSYGLSLHDQGFSDSSNQITPVSGFLASDSLKSSGEESDDWRLQFRGYKRDSATLAHSPSITLDDGTSASGWTAGSFTTVTATTDSGRSVIAIAASGGAGSATLAFSPSSTTEAYRYLRITLRASTGKRSVDVTMASRSWGQLELSTSYVDIDLDLCCPRDETGPVGTVDTRYPIESDGGFPTNDPPDFQYSFGWGVNYIDSIQFSGIANGTTIYVDSISVVRKTDAKLTLLSAFDYFPLGWRNEGPSHDGTNGDSTSVQPYAYLQIDAKGPVDFPHAAIVVPDNGATYYRPYIISELVFMWNQIPGLTATNLADSSDGYHTNGLYAMLLGGAGATYDHTSKTWTDWIDADLTGGALTIPAQDLLDEVQAYPGAGEVWNSGLYDVPVPLVVSKSLRGQAYGLAYGKKHDPSVGLVVMAQQDSGAFAGVGVVRSDARYFTGPPYGQGGHSVETVIVGPDYSLFAIDVWHNRMRQRTSFIPDAVPCVGTPPRLPNDCASALGGLPYPTTDCSSTVGECACGQVKVKRLPQPEKCNACR